ncbi:MAG TPA: arsenic transporter [Burkholderiaceae bacterium]|nr:arsenic transporter [Burkholderiaceae bacterium]
MPPLPAIAAVLIFIGTLLLVIFRPWKLGIGWSALAGAVACGALGLIHLSDVREIWHIVWNATATLIAIIITNSLLDEAGFFKWAALHIVRWGRGRTSILFVLIILFGATVAGLLTNDGAALILTPIVMELLLALEFPAPAIFAFVMSAGFISDTASIPLTISNLVNILSADYFGLGFRGYAAIMIPVDVVAIAASLLVLHAYFKRRMPRSYHFARPMPPAEAVRDPLTFHAGWMVLLATLAGFFTLDRYNVPTSVVAGAGAALLLVVAGRRHIVGTRKVLRHAPWNVVVFSLGMYLVVMGLRNTGMTSWLSDLFRLFAGSGIWGAALGVGFVSAFLSSVTNNLPGVLLGMLSIHDAGATGAVHQAMVYANIIGSDLGPKITPIGSLATLLWLHVLARRGTHVSWGAYFRTGIVLTVPVLFFTLMALALSLQLVR